MNKVFIGAHKFQGRWLHAQIEFASHLILIVCFVGYNKWILSISVHLRSTDLGVDSPYTFELT